MFGPLRFLADGSDGAGSPRFPRLAVVGVALLLLLASTVAAVRLNEDRLGSTDRGTLWTIAPHGTFVVTAETATGNVSATATNV